MKRRIHKIEYSIPNPESPDGREHKTAYVDAYSGPRARTTLFNELFRIESQSTAKADELSEAIRSMSQGLPGISVFYEPEDASAEAQGDSTEDGGQEEGHGEAAETTKQANTSEAPAAESEPAAAAPAAPPSAPEPAAAAFRPPTDPTPEPSPRGVPF